MDTGQTTTDTPTPAEPPAKTLTNISGSEFDDLQISIEVEGLTEAQRKRLSDQLKWRKNIIDRHFETLEAEAVIMRLESEIIRCQGRLDGELKDRDRMAVTGEQRQYEVKQERCRATIQHYQLEIQVMQALFTAPAVSDTDDETEGETG